MSQPSQAKPSRTFLATSTLHTLVLHDLGLELLAGVPTPIPASAVARIRALPGVVMDEAPSPEEI